MLRVFLLLLFAFKFSVCLSSNLEPIVLVHGGAGDIPGWRVNGKLRGVSLAAQRGYNALLKTGNVTTAVEEAVKSMELDDYFNAGYGSVLNSEGFIQMDASIMDGSSLKVGCVTGIVDIMHPISLARRVMEKTPHNFLASEGAMNFAEDQGFELLPTGSLVSEYAYESWLEWKESERGGAEYRARKFGEVGTVGAVAFYDGNIAVATSTGGMTGKLPGRVGDTPIIGAGTYADNNLGGVSATGHGETIMKVALTHDILKRVEYLKEDIQTACDNSLKLMTERLNETAGVIALDNQGNVGISFTSEQMAWAYQRGNLVRYGIEHGDSFEKTVETPLGVAGNF